MKRLIVLALAFALVVSAAAFGQSADSISAASVKNYYPALTGQDLMQALKNSSDTSAGAGNKRNWACSMSTVNADGTPNVAVVIPGYADDETVRFGLAPNQTLVNLKARKMGVLTLYIRDPGAPADKKDPVTGRAYTDYGARLILELIEDPAAIKTLLEKTKSREGTLFLKIVRVLPLG